MDADFAVELGPDDPVLEMPWSSPGGKPVYFDLKRQPELLQQLPEARAYPELWHFLARVNSPKCALQSAKCDVWFTTELGADEVIHDKPGKFGCYVDLLFSGARRFDFPAHEEFAREVVKHLRNLPEMPMSAEMIVRRCYFRSADRPGFYFTLYVFGYGDEEVEGPVHWAIALELVGNALLRASGVEI